MASSLMVLELSPKFFSGRLVEGYKDLLRSDRLDTFAKRHPLSVADYEKLFYEEAQLDDTGSTQFADYHTGLSV